MRLAIPMIAVAATLGLTACGGGGEADTSTAETTATDPGLAPDPATDAMATDTGTMTGDPGAMTTDAPVAPVTPATGTPVDSTTAPPPMEPTTTSDPTAPAAPPPGN
ncbi:hypothetical protein ACFOMD_11355 [Sphingoaurantiacus capsulatus]|uniref:Lipoprotein n=1 Tax=Sphingoaurantiacus capsulatus TaxID=1771310 RepID=A0ABV7XD52_9SPHN